MDASQQLRTLLAKSVLPVDSETLAMKSQLSLERREREDLTGLTQRRRIFLASLREVYAKSTST
jgi:hypothetical protein